MQPATAQSKLSLAEAGQAHELLQQTETGAIGAIVGLTDAQWTFKPAPGSWSIAEIMEHVTCVQERVLGMLRDQLPAAPAGPAERPIALIDAIVIHQFPSRLMKAQAPEFLAPKGGMNIAEARARLSANTRRLNECLTSIPDLREHLLESPPLQRFTNGEHGVMDGYQWILAAAAHTERHTKQILEVKAAANFPAN